MDISPFPKIPTHYDNDGCFYGINDNMEINTMISTTVKQNHMQHTCVRPQLLKLENTVLLFSR